MDKIDTIYQSIGLLRNSISLNHNNPCGSSYPMGWLKLPRVRGNLSHRVGGKIWIYNSLPIELQRFIFTYNGDEISKFQSVYSKNLKIQ